MKEQDQFLVPPPRPKSGGGFGPIDEWVPEILERLSQGETLTAVCRDFESRKPAGPSVRVVRERVIKDEPPGLAIQYQRARDLMLEFWADEMEDIARNAKPTQEIEVGEYTTKNGEPRQMKKTRTRDAVERDKLHISSRQWLMSKLAPHRYGEKVEVQTTHEIGDTLSQTLDKIRNSRPTIDITPSGPTVDVKQLIEDAANGRKPA